MITIIGTRYGDKKVHLGLIRHKATAEDSFMSTVQGVEKFNREHRTNTRLIQPEIADHLLVHKKAERLQEYSPFIVDALIGYEERENGSFTSKPFGPEITFWSGKKRIYLPTKEYEGQRNRAIFFSGIDLADFVESEPEIRIKIPAERVRLLQDFPATNGWYRIDSTGIPTGDPVAELASTKMDEEVRFLMRLQKPRHRTGSFTQDSVIPYGGKYIGPIYRCAADQESNLAARTICAQPTAIEGIIVEIPEEDLKKLKSTFNEKVRRFFLRSKNEPLLP